MKYGSVTMNAFPGKAADANTLQRVLDAQRAIARSFRVPLQIRLSQQTLDAIAKRIDQEGGGIRDVTREPRVFPSLYGVPLVIDPLVPFGEFETIFDPKDPRILAPVLHDFQAMKDLLA